MKEPQPDIRARVPSSHSGGDVIRQSMAAAWRICGMRTRQDIWHGASAELHHLTGAAVVCLEADRSGRLTRTLPESHRPFEHDPGDGVARLLDESWLAERRPSMLDLDEGRVLAASCTDTKRLRGGLVLIDPARNRLTDDDRAALALIALATGHTLGVIGIEATSVPLDRHESALNDQRRDLSHQLHTGPAQDLATATMALELLRSSTTIPHLNDDARIALAYVGLAGENLRQFVAQLRGEAPAAPSAGSARVAASSFFPGIGQEEAMLAIVREAIRNSRKHADAGTVSVSVRRDQTGVSVQISDDGRGFSGESPVGHFGLAQIRDLAGAMGGDIAIESVPGRGTIVRFRVPEPTVDPIAPLQDHHSGDPIA